MDVWRTEPEIDRARQDRLRNLQVASVSAPFKGTPLARADIEWLLVDHRARRRQEDLDLTGVILRCVDLSRLPLAHLVDPDHHRPWPPDPSPSQFPLGYIATAGVATSSPQTVRLTGADLRGADLKECDLRGAALDGVLLDTDPDSGRAACLCGANLSGASLQVATLSGTCLKGADLTGATLRGATLEGARLDGAMLSRAHLDPLDDAHITNLRGAWLDGATMAHTQLSKACMEGAHLTRANLDDAIIVEGVLEGARLQGARLRGAFVVSANLRGARMVGADLRDAHLEKADLTGAQLRQAHLGNARLHGATLVRVDLGRSDMTKARLEATTNSAATWNKDWMEELYNIRQHTQKLDVRLGRTVGTSGTALVAGSQGAASFPAAVDAANLQRATLDVYTVLDDIVLGSAAGCAFLADITWGGADLATVSWTHLCTLGVGEEQRVVGKAMPGREELRDAARADNQLALALRQRALNREAANFTLRARRLEARLQKIDGPWYAYRLSSLLDFTTGYGYSIGRALRTYGLIVLSFTLLQLVFVPRSVHASWWQHLVEAAVDSVYSFHGRGLVAFTPEAYASPTAVDAQAILGAFEAVIGLLTEIAFIVTFSRRFFDE